MEFCAGLDGANLDTLEVNFQRRMGPKSTRARDFFNIDEERAAALSGDPERIRRAKNKRLGFIN